MRSAKNMKLISFQASGLVDQTPWTYLGAIGALSLKVSEILYSSSLMNTRI